MKASWKTERVVFSDCYLNIGSELDSDDDSEPSSDLDSDIDLFGPTYSISYLSFRGTGSMIENNWKEQSDKFKRIIKAISLSTLKFSLKTLDVCDWGLLVSNVKKMLKDFDMEQVKVVQDYGLSIDE